MLSRRITETDKFLAMPLSAHALYFHLNIGADDDGFIDKPRTIQRSIGASEDDLKILIAKQFLIPFDSGVVVIKDWRVHNYIQRDRYQETLYQEEKATLFLDESGSWQLKNSSCIHSVSNMDTQDRLELGKDRLELINNYTRVTPEGQEVTLTPDEQESTLLPAGEQEGTLPFVFPDWLSKEAVEAVQHCKSTQLELRIPIAYLNQVFDSNYRFVDSNIRYIKARFKEGHTLEDFKVVVDKMVQAWGGDGKMRQYLRPQTLFGPKMDSYLNWQVPGQGRSNFGDNMPDMPF